MAVGPSRQESQAEFAVRRSGEHLGQDRWRVVVTNHEVVAGARIDRQPRVPKVRVDDTGLILLVVVHPQLNRRLGRRHRL